MKRVGGQRYDGSLRRAVILPLVEWAVGVRMRLSTGVSNRPSGSAHKYHIPSTD